MIETHLILWSFLGLPLSFGFHYFIYEGEWKKKKGYFLLYIIATSVWLNYLFVLI